MRKELAVLLSAAALCQGGTAASDPGSSRFERRYDTTLTYRLDPARSPDVTGFVTLDLKMVARVWTLMGEPVVYCSASWKMRNATVQIRRRGELHWLLDMPQKTWDAVDLVQATIGYPIARKNQSFRETSHAWVPCDIGATNGNGDPRGSFNVPGSPNWDRLLISRQRFQGSRPWDAAENFMSAADAKAMLKSPDFEMRPAEPGNTQDDMGLRFDFNFWPWINWLDEHLAQKEAERLAERAKTRKKVGDSLDPFDAMVQDVETTTVQRTAKAASGETDAARRKTAEQVEQRRRTLAQKGCLSAADAANPLPDFDAAAARAEAGHEKCGSGAGVVAFRDKESGKYGYKRPDGSVLIEPRFNRAENFAEGLGLVYTPECGESACYVNAGGAVVLKLRASRAGSFSDGLAWVRDDDTKKVGYVDHDGRFVIAARFDSGEPFAGGRAKVSTHLRTEESDNRCKVGNLYFHSVGYLSTSGQWLSGPAEESSRGPSAICLTRTTN